MSAAVRVRCDRRNLIFSSYRVITDHIVIYPATLDRLWYADLPLTNRVFYPLEPLWNAAKLFDSIVFVVADLLLGTAKGGADYYSPTQRIPNARECTGAVPEQRVPRSTEQPVIGTSQCVAR